MKKMITIPDEMNEALAEVSRKTGIPQSRLIRDAIAHILEQHGLSADPAMQWGGKRSGQKKKGA